MGFGPKQSTNLALLDLIEEIIDALDDKNNNRRFLT